jgi:iron complex outermembrane receptor protein
MVRADSPQPAPAGPVALKQLSLEELSQIDVTSPTKEPTPAFQTPVAIYVITNEDIRRSGATTIPEVLRLAPGVEVARVSSDEWSIGIRGFGSRLSRNVLVLIDGRTVYSTLLAGTYWEVQDTVLEDIDRIEVIRGPGGTIWGPNAVDGVINIITKDSKDTQGTLISAGGGTVDQGFTTFRYGGGNGTDFSYRFYTKAFSRGPEEHPDHQNFDDWRGAQGGFRLDWNEHDRDLFTLQGDIYYELVGERETSTSYTPPYSQNIDSNADLSGGNVMARWKRVLSPTNDFQLQIYFDRTNRAESNFADFRDTFDVDFTEHLSTAWRQHLTWGLGARVSPGYNPVIVSGLQFLPTMRTDQLYTGFLQDEIALVEHRLTLTAGSKVLRTNFDHLEFEPSVRLMWTPDQSHSVWAAFTHAVRTPSDAEEDFYLSGYQGSLNGIPFFARFNGNPNFGPEQLNGYELGYRELLKKNIYVDVATFYNHYHDLFDEEVTGPIFLEDNPAPAHLLLPAQFGNGLLGTTKGFEIAPEWRPTGNWRLRGSYSFLTMKVEPSPGSPDIGSSPAINNSSPKHEVVLQSAWDLSKNFSLDLTYRYVSVLSALGVPAYSTGDARFAWRARPGLELSVVGQNLFQPSHAEYEDDAGPPLIGIRRDVYAKITWSK